MFDMLRKAMTLAYLGINLWTDLKWMRIWWPLTVLMLPVAAVMQLANGTAMTALLMGCLPGLGVLILAGICPRKIGAGDALVLLVCGCLEKEPGITASLEFLFMALLLASLCTVLTALFADLRQGTAYQVTVPFLPFLLAARICLDLTGV